MQVSISQLESSVSKLLSSLEIPESIDVTNISSDEEEYLEVDHPPTDSLEDMFLQFKCPLSSYVDFNDLSSFHRIPESDQTSNIYNDPIKELMKKSEITSMLASDRPVDKKLSWHGKKKKRKEQSESTAGDMWFNMPRAEMSEEVKQELTLLNLRNAFDTKHFYNKGAKITAAMAKGKAPRYFQIGRVIESSVHSKINTPVNKKRKSLVNELLEDAQFRKSNKKRYQAMQIKRGNFIRKKNSSKQLLAIRNHLQLKRNRKK